MSAFVGAFGDKRRAAAVARLYGAIVEQTSLVIRKLGADRGGELAAHLADPVLGARRLVHLWEELVKSY